jgi:hypothetical protein
MERRKTTKKRTRVFIPAFVGIGVLLTLNSALAAPPAGRSPKGQIQSLGQRLDLRAPSHAVEVSEGPTAFPSKTHHPLGASEQMIQLPQLGLAGAQARPGIQQFVRQVRREGLPVARLFESKSALVHLGLSPKGKPGLWLVQKTH